MKKLIAITAAIMAVSGASQAIDLKSLFGSGQVLQKFAVKAQEEMTLQGKGDKQPVVRSKDIYLQCDFSTALECTNEFVARSTSTLWIRRDAKSAEKPYSVVVAPQLIDGKYNFGPYSTDELTKGVDLLIDKSSGPDKRLLKMKLAVVEGK